MKIFVNNIHKKITGYFLTFIKVDTVTLLYYNSNHNMFIGTY